MKTSSTRLVAAMIAVLILFNSCASILNPKRQKVLLFNSESSKVYVDGELAFRGKNGYVKMERDMNVRQIRLDVDGYKPEYFAHTQYKKSWLYGMSWVPFGVLFLMPPLYDMGNKSFNYDNQRKLEPRTPIVERGEDQKHVYLDRTAFEVDKDDIVFEKYPLNRYLADKNERASEYGDEDIKVDNSIFTDALNQLLLENGFIDTVSNIFKDKTNTLYISAEVDKLTFKEVYVRKAAFYNWFVVLELGVKWTIQDVYKQPLFEDHITCTSGEFSPDFYDFENELFKKIMDDGMSTSFYEFLSMNEVQDLLEEEVARIPEYETLTLEKPASSPKKLSNAQAATVTVNTKEGHGSGCIVSSNGYIITNFHVVSGSEDDIEIIMNDGQKFPGEVIRQNEYYDLALVKIEKKTFDSYILHDDDQYEVGDEVYAIGTPNSIELGQTLSKGIVSGTRKKEDREWIQTDVSISPGNSGGALVDKNGDLIGIVNSKLVGFGVEGISFCIPSKFVFEMLSISYGS